MKITCPNCQDEVQGHHICIQQGMKPANAVEKKYLICDRCEQEIVFCDDCAEGFIENDDIRCNNNVDYNKHYHVGCVEE